MTEDVYSGLVDMKAVPHLASVEPFATKGLWFLRVIRSSSVTESRGHHFVLHRVVNYKSHILSYEKCLI